MARAPITHGSSFVTSLKPSHRGAGGLSGCARKMSGRIGGHPAAVWRSLRPRPPSDQTLRFMPTSAFHPVGAPRVVRHVLRGQVWCALPVTVVHDDENFTAFHVRPGTEWLVATGRSGRRVRPSPASWRLAPRTWDRHHALHIAEPGTAFAFIGFWTRARLNFVRWYVNLQEPLRRTNLGFDTMDQELDIVLSEDRRQWIWKDEVEFGRMVASGLLSKDKAEEIRSIGRSAVTRVQQAIEPFGSEWSHWRPAVSADPPRLPLAWDEGVTLGSAGDLSNPIAAEKRQS